MPKGSPGNICYVKIHNRIAGFFLYRSSRLAAPAAADKEGLASASGKHTVNMAFKMRPESGQRGPCFHWDGPPVRFNCLMVSFVFVHGEFYTF